MLTCTLVILLYYFITNLYRFVIWYKEVFFLWVIPFNTIKWLWASVGRDTMPSVDTIGELVDAELGSLLGSKGGEVRYSRLLCFYSCYEVI
jgi:hypothetical protein